MPVAQIILALLALGTLLSLAFWAVALRRIVLTRRLPTARAGYDEPAVPNERVCVIVPAHNESSKISKLLESLIGQDHERVSFLIVLDRCTDDTLEIARRVLGDDNRFEIVEITECADGWAGKVNAVHTAVQRSPKALDADLLLFCDADTWFEPGTVRAAAAFLRSRGLQLLSLVCTLTSDRWFERLVQPAAGMELFYQYPLERANAIGERRRGFANGQFLLFDAPSYREIGGHAAVHEELLEDLAFARLMQHRKRPAGVALADGVVRCRMYESWEQFTRGWKRIFTEAAKRKPTRLRSASLRVLGVAVAMPLGSGVAVVVGAAFISTPLGVSTLALGLASLVIQVFGWASAYTTGGAPARYAPLYPIGAVLVARILRRAARELDDGTPTSWGGMQYGRPVRE
ncbi:MAG: glycosyltransferase family 2 protein [Planctomycetota bacterium]